MFVSSFVLWVDVLSTKYLFFSMCSLNSKRCIISMCSTNQRERVRVLPSGPAEWVMGFKLFTHYLCRSDFQNNRKTSIYMRLHIVSTKKIIKYFKQQPPVLCLFCSGVQCSITDQGHSTSRSQHCFVLKPYFPHAWCEIFEMFFKSTTWKLVM